MHKLGGMERNQSDSQVRIAIVNFYKKASYCYGIPFVFLVLQFLLNTVSDFNLQPFLALFGVTLLPLSIMGIIFTKRGFVLASSTGDREKKDVGYANFLLGALLLGITIFGSAVVYTMR